MCSKKTKTAIVLGSPRSGTSMTAGLLSILGVDMGRVRPPDFENPTGYFEDIEFSKLIADLFRAANPQADGFNPPSQSELMKQFPKFHERAKRLIAQRIQNARSPVWGWKVTSTIFVMPLFLPYLPDPHFIVVVRNPLDIARSMINYTRRKGYKKLSLVQALKLTNLYYMAIFTFLEEHSTLPWCVVSYEELLKEPHSHIQKILTFLGIEANQKQIMEACKFVNPRIGRKKYIWRLRTRFARMCRYVLRGIRNPSKASRFVYQSIKSYINRAVKGTR